MTSFGFNGNDKLKLPPSHFGFIRRADEAVFITPKDVILTHTHLALLRDSSHFNLQDHLSTEWPHQESASQST